MQKLKQPVALNATIYNRLVKVFNDAANGYTEFNGRLVFDNGLKELRPQIIELRKQFPTYQELKDSGIKFVDYPQYLDSASNKVVDVQSWIAEDTDAGIDAGIFDASVVYSIKFARGYNKDLQPIIGLKISGTKKV